MTWATGARVALMLWRRETLQWLRSPTRALGGLLMPALFLLVLGYGAAPVVQTVGGLEFRAFVFPGALAVSLATTAVFAAGATVRDREAGFLKQVLAAPVPRSAILAGKTLGGATVATLQGFLFLALLPFSGLDLAMPQLLATLAAIALVALPLAALGLWVACAARGAEAFQGLTQFVLFPMVFLSGALFPLQGLPPWLAAVHRIDPLTYAVQPLRGLLAGQGDVAVGLLVLAAAGAVAWLGALWELTRRT